MENYNETLSSTTSHWCTSAPMLAGPATGYKSSGGFAREEKCFKTEYREEYVPGTAKNPGYVKSYKKKVRVPCRTFRLDS